MAEVYHNSAVPPIVPTVELDMDDSVHDAPHSPRAKVSLAVEYGWLFLLILMFSFIWSIYGVGVVNSKKATACSAKQPSLIQLATANVVFAFLHLTTPVWMYCIHHLFPRRR